MEKEYKTEELKAVWLALLKVYGENQKGCTAQEIAAATGLSEEVARACLEYLKQDGKVEQAGDIYAPNPNYVRNVTVNHAAEVVNKYLMRKKSATVDEIAAGIQNEEGGNIKRDLVESALGYLQKKGHVKFSAVTQKWVSTAVEV
jgi:hypothetical protein